MWIPLGLLMKEHFQFPCFGWTLKVCIVFIVLTFKTSLACYGGGYYGWGTTRRPDYDYDEDWEKYLNSTGNKTHLKVIDLDERLVVNLTGITDPLERNIKTSWHGWEPNVKTQKEWREFYNKHLAENEKNGEMTWKQRQKGKKGKGGDGDGDGDEARGPGAKFSKERGPGSGWPDIPGWADLGAGSGGAPIPPWAYVPKNVGKPTICYLAPIRGTCKLKKDKDKKPVERWGYNPYMDECQKYIWSGCGGTRNRFITKASCTKHCEHAPPSCSSDSGILAVKSPKMP